MVVEFAESATCLVAVVSVHLTGLVVGSLRSVVVLLASGGHSVAYLPPPDRCSCVRQVCRVVLMRTGCLCVVFLPDGRMGSGAERQRAGRGRHWMRGASGTKPPWTVIGSPDSF